MTQGYNSSLSPFPSLRAPQITIFPQSTFQGGRFAPPFVRFVTIASLRSPHNFYFDLLQKRLSPTIYPHLTDPIVVVVVVVFWTLSKCQWRTQFVGTIHTLARRYAKIFSSFYPSLSTCPVIASTARSTCPCSPFHCMQSIFLKDRWDQNSESC